MMDIQKPTVSAPQEEAPTDAMRLRDFVNEANDVTEMCWYDHDSQMLGFMANGERCYVKMERFLAAHTKEELT